MEVYGETGYVHPLDGTHIRFLADRSVEVLDLEVDNPKAPYDNPANYFVAVVREEVDPRESLSSLENNMIVT